MKILNKEQVLEACKSGWNEEEMGFPFPSDAVYFDMLAVPMLEAQAKLTREENLKEVGEWLETRELYYAGSVQDMCLVRHSEVKVLLRGELHSGEIANGTANIA